jgi:hypothetical protein
MGMFDHLPGTGSASGGGIFDHIPALKPQLKPSVPTYVEGEDGKEVALDAQQFEQMKAEQLAAQKADDEAFAATRTPGARVADTAAFLASAPVRMATRGEYGAGDVAGAVSPAAGEALKEAEADFARANETGLEIAGAVGDVTMGIPFLNTMGAPIGGLKATAKHIANKPRSAAARIPVRNERLADVKAFEDAGVRPFGPALTEVGSAGAIKQLSEVPIVGAPVRNALKETVEQTKAAGEDVAAGYGTAKNYRDSGLAAERGLERFKDARPPDVVDDAIVNLSDDQLRDIIGKRARDTSAKTRLGAMYERAWRGLPENMREGRTELDRSRIGGQLVETRKVLHDLTQRNSRMLNTTRLETEGNAIARPVRGGLAGQIVDDILADSPPTFMLQDMRNVRSTFRRLASGMSDTEKNTLTRADMDRVQSAMTRDLIRTLERNRDSYAAAGNKPFTVKAAKDGQPAIKQTGAQIAQQVNRAILDFRRADTATRRNAQHLEMIDKLYKAGSPEALAQNIVRDAQGGTKGNYNRLFALKRAVNDEEWSEISSGIIRELGTPTRGARGVAQEADFSVQSFLSNWRGIDPKAKHLLFGSTKDKGHYAALENFARVADRMANFEALVNSSRTGTNLINFSALAAGGGLIAAGQIPALVLGSLGTYGVAAFLSSPMYVKWLTRAVNLSNDPKQLINPKAYLRELAKIVAKDPGSEAKFAAQNLLQQFSNQADAALASQSPDGQTPQAPMPPSTGMQAAPRPF